MADAYEHVLKPLDPNNAFKTPISGKHARVSSSTPEKGWTSGQESLRAHLGSGDDGLPLKKRLRVSRLVESDESSDDETALRPVLPCQRRSPAQISAATMHRMARILPPGMSSLKRAKVNLSPWTSSFVSNNTLDVYRVASEQEHRTWAPPFSCSFSNASRTGGKPMLAVSDEEGGVCFVDATRNAHDDRAQGRVTMKAHENAIFDVRWSPDDSIIATASGDQTVGITDVLTQKAVVRLVGHLSSVKLAVWDPSNTKVLATASRDGSIRIWDIRETNDGFGAPTNLIRNAHCLPGKGASVSRTPRSAARSVTSLAFLPQRNGLLASAGTADGIIKLWDLRKTHTRRANPECLAQSADLTRGRGIASLALSGHSDRLHALGVDSSLYTLDPLALAYGESPIPGVRRTEGTNSFYVRLSTSPCGRWLVSGSSKGEALIWDTEAPCYVEPTRLRGHSAEVGAVDWSNDVIASCGDDLQVRLWRPNLGLYRRAMNDAELRKWHWAGAWPKEQDD